MEADRGYETTGQLTRLMDTSTSPPVACPRLGSLPGTMLALLSPLGLMALFRRTTEPAVGLPVKALFLLPFGVLTICWLYLAFAAKPQQAVLIASSGRSPPSSA